MAIYLVYIELLTFLNSSNYSVDLLSITNFMHNENLMDCFTDNNRIYLTISLVLDFGGTLILNFLTLFFLNNKFYN